MPRTALPPTPASSTDIHGMDGTKQLSSLKMTFELPEPAMNHTNNSARPSSSGNNPASNQAPAPESPASATSPRTPYPIQPSEAVKARRRSSAATAAAAARESSSFALPPPPTRSRKIIQMKPRPQEEKRPAPEPAASASGKGAGKRPAATATAASGSGSAAAETSSSKKKQPSATSAAGRKIARKTAHSLIERRRRSKMNEEFAVLKDMIPACEGEMHKLAILQVSLGVSAVVSGSARKLTVFRLRSSTSDTSRTASKSSRLKETLRHQPRRELRPSHPAVSPTTRSSSITTSSTPTRKSSTPQTLR